MIPDVQIIVIGELNRYVDVSYPRPSFTNVFVGTS